MTAVKSLAGRRIVITRAREQASELAAKLNSLGAEVVELPLIKISREIDKQNLADTMLELGNYDWIIFTSANGVRFFFEQFFKLFDDIRAFGLLRFACVGAGTAREIEAFHLKVECQPEHATAADLADALIKTGSLDNAKVLVITGNLNRDELVQKLEEAQAIVDRLQVYKTEPTDLTGDPVAENFRENGADAVLFTSASTVNSFVDQARALLLAKTARIPLAGSIGPLTSEAMKTRGLPIAFIAKQPNLDSLVDALVKKLNS
ncbi:MAG: uroporphyrinogen-III synthase [Cephaloticoccus sp.]|nr:uroporphyrinogen-III synthase [Cephaloticoccus sp.]MCF7761250.1 uroporphyrinogen-III synthase [Cephaloticoccus sp.]